MPCASLDVGPGGQVGVVWTSSHVNEVPDVYFAESIDGGASFGPNHRTHPDAAGIQRLPDIAYDGLGAAHAFWEDSTEPAWEVNIHHAATSDGGAVFTPPERVNDDPPEESNLQEKVAAAGLAGGGVVAVWMDGRQNLEDNVYFAGPALSGVGGETLAAARTPRAIPSLTRGATAFWGARVRIFDTQGRNVAELGRPGDREDRWLHWDGRDGRGHPVAAGAYRALVTSDGRTAGRGVVVVR
jgi:hypothetical protein